MQVRENQPWTAAQAMPSVISGSAVMCPALRLCPLLALALLNKQPHHLWHEVVVNFIANPLPSMRFWLVELLGLVLDYL